MRKVIFFNVGRHTFGARFEHLQTILKLKASSPSFVVKDGKKQLNFENITARVHCIKEMLQLKGDPDTSLEKNIIVLRWKKFSFAFPVDFIAGVVEVKEIYPMPPVYRQFIQSGFSHMIRVGKRMIPAIEPDGLKALLPDSVLTDSTEKGECDTISRKDREAENTSGPLLIPQSSLPLNFSSKKMNRSGKVIILPARSPMYKGRHVHFLFSVTQIEDIARPFPVYRLPASPPHVDGVTLWRGQILPVISLERYLNLEIKQRKESHRSLIVRYPLVTMEGTKILRASITVSPFIEHLAIPSGNPLNVNEFFSDPVRFKGIFDWDSRLLCVMDLGVLLKGHFLKTKG